MDWRPKRANVVLAVDVLDASDVAQRAAVDGVRNPAALDFLKADAHRGAGKEGHLRVFYVMSLSVWEVDADRDERLSSKSRSKCFRA